MILDGLMQPLSVTRSAAYTNVGGTLTPGTATTLTVRAIVQPARGGELLNFPEGERTREAIKIYSDAPLQTGDETAGTRADVVTYAGRRYEVRRVDTWPQTALAHYRAFAFKVERDPGTSPASD